jgi:threonine dehydrogenase-like Zn-dependent dehydrogenase
VRGPRDYRVEEVERPRPGFGDVLIKVDASGICASDIKCWSGSSMFWGPNGAVKPPVVPGHEFAGTVVELGEGAADLHGVSVGDRVLAEQIIPCGTCRYCRGGQYWMCEPHKIFGFTGWQSNGGMAEYMLLPRRARIHAIHAAIPAREAAYIEPLACAIHAVDRGEIRPGDTVVIAGVGNIGLCMLQAARRFNPGQIIAVDTKPYRLELARQLGADVVINPLDEDAPARVRGLTEGYGCDVYIEATGNGLGPQQGLDMIRRLGTLVAFSVMADPVNINWNLVGDQRELNIHGSHLGPYCYPKAIAALAEGSINVKPLITAEYPLAEFATAMDAARGGDNLKTLILP